MTVAEIYKYFRENSIKEIRLEYSGSGDDGGVDDVRIKLLSGEELNNTGAHPEVVDALEAITYDKTGADFNNDGSQGLATFIFNEETHIIDMEIEHQFNITSTEDHSYAEELVDPDEYI